MEKQILEALSPWAEVDTSKISGLNPRLDTLNGKVIGMFGDFMDSSIYMLKAVEAEILKTYPEAKFSYLQYIAETTRIMEDENFIPKYKEWISQVDACVVFYGAVPSSSLFLGYNAAYMEKDGKPTVMAVSPRTYSAGIRGVKAIGVPGLRTFSYVSPVDIWGHAAKDEVVQLMAPLVEEVTAKVLDGLTRPLTEEEKNPSEPNQNYAKQTYVGSAREISETFYKLGFTNGQPIEIPTKEAVDEMLTAYDGDPEDVIGYIPPKMGKATVKSIAVNAVMAGCLPTYLPVLIAAVKGALDKCIYLEGWTCSQSTWGPILTVSGKLVNDIGLNTGTNALSPYTKANAVIGRAFGYIMMNIGGLRPGIEDLSEAGHENRLGICIGDSWDNNPWGPAHEKFGFDRDDNCVTMFWPQEHRTISGRSPADFLSGMCEINPYGWDPGALFLFTPKCAGMFVKEGWTKQRILDYVVEYARHPASEVDIPWLVNNNHPPKSVDIPVNMKHSTRIFWTDEHMFSIVSGGHAGAMMTVFAGGGDHGGPSCTKIELPKNWAELVEKYAEIKPEYIDY